VAATNANGDSAKTTNYARYTLAGPPYIGNNLACDKIVSTLYSASTTFTFSNPAGFGAGTHGGSAYIVSKFKWAWDTDATRTFTDTEPDWNSGALPQSPASSGSYYLHLKSFNAENVAGGTLDYGPFVIDTDAPTPAITGATTLTNAVRTLTINFGEVVNGFALGDIAVSNGVASNLLPAGAASSYTVSVLGSGTATVSVSIAGSVATDNAGNPNNPTAAAFTFPFDGVEPTASILLDDPTPTGADAVNFSVDFSESVGASFTAADVTVAGELSGTPVVSGSDPNYTVTVTLANPAANGTVGITVGTSVSDAAGNAFAGGSSPLYTIANWPGFVAELQDAQKYSGDSHTFDASIVSGSATYQWKWDTGGDQLPVNGPTTPTWALTGLTTANRGQYWCEVTYNGTVYPTRQATLSVEDHLQITTEPVGGAKSPNMSHTFTVQTSGGYAPLGYVWKKDGEEMLGATEASYTLDNLTADDAGIYTVEVSDAHNDIDSASAELTIVTSNVPVLGLVGLGALLGLMSIGSARKLHRK
jgi:hypothetical protein